MSEWPTTFRKYSDLGAAMAAELMTGFRLWGSGQSELLHWVACEQWQQMKLPPEWQNKLSYNK